MHSNTPPPPLSSPLLVSALLPPLSFSPSLRLPVPPPPLFLPSFLILFGSFFVFNLVVGVLLINVAAVEEDPKPVVEGEETEVLVPHAHTHTHTRVCVFVNAFLQRPEVSSVMGRYTLVLALTPVSPLLVD